jgi:hypothetical protein
LTVARWAALAQLSAHGLPPDEGILQGDANRNPFNGYERTLTPEGDVRIVFKVSIPM